MFSSESGFGAGGCPGPLEMSSLTAESRLTCVPAGGFEAITLPAGTTLLDEVLIDPARRPALVRAEAAADCVSPTTLGTAVVVAWPFRPPMPFMLTCWCTTAGERFMVLSLKDAVPVK